MKNPIRRHLGVSLNPLAGISEVLFIQGKLQDLRGIATVARDVELGAVYTLENRNGRVSTKAADIINIVDEHRKLVGAQGTVLLDAGRYSGRNRRPGTALLDSSFVDFQLRDLRLPYALTDSGYIDKNDHESLGSVLRQTSDLARGRPVVAVLALDSSWFRDHPAALREAIERYRVPVALAAGHSKDPYSTSKAVLGLMELLESDVPICNLRSDLAVIGALASGSAFGAIGTTSGLRHVYPPKKGGGPSYIAGTSLIVPHARGWARQERVRDAAALTPHEPHWRCPCDACAGRRLDTIYGDDTIYRHNLLAASDLARSVLDEDPARRLATWASQCGAAQFVNMDIADSTGSWTTPSYLSAWYEAVDIRAVTRP